MLNLRDNAFYLLGVSPEATAAEVADAFDDAVMDAPADEAKLQKAKNALAAPKKRLPEELLSLWGVPAGKWEQWLAKDNPGEWGELSGVARMNLSAHFMSALSAGDYSDDLRRAMLGQIIEAQNDFLTIMPDIRAARKKAGMPPPSDEHFREALLAVSEKHCQAAMCAIETAEKPGSIMTDVAEEWRYNKTESGRFVSTFARAYDLWSIPKLRPIEQDIDRAINALQGGIDENALDDIDYLLAEWDKYSQPMQLMNEAKGLDDPRSRELLGKLHSLAIDLANNRKEYDAALRISNALSKTFPELPGKAGRLAEDIKTLRKLSERKVANEQARELAGLIKKIKETPSAFSSLAKRVCQILRRMSADENAWRFVRSAAIELFNQGNDSEARAMAESLAQWADECGAPQAIREMLRKDLATLELMNAHSLIETAMKEKDVSAAVKNARIVAKLTDNAQEKEAMQKFVDRQDLKKFFGFLKIAAVAVFFLWLFLDDSTGGGDVRERREVAQQHTPAVKPEKRPPPVPVRLMHVASASGANVRAAPGTSHHVLLSIPRYSNVKGVGGVRDSWQKITYGGTTGYIHANLLALGDGGVAKCEAGVRRPGNGEVFTPSRGGANTIEIDSTRSDSDVIAKLKTSNGATALAFYVRAGNRVSFDTIPAGLYKFQYATGSRYSFSCRKFMNSEGVFEDPNTQHFKTGYKSVLTYQLYNVQGGNFRGRKIPEDSF